jgi:hypothetical protein
MGSHGTKTSSYGMFHKSIFLYQDNTYEMQKQMCLKHSHKNAHYFSMFSLFFSLFLALKDIWLFNLFTLSVYLIKVISEARRVPNEGYSRSTWYSGFLQHKTDSHDITDILLKVALNTITLWYKVCNYLLLNHFVYHPDKCLCQRFISPLTSWVRTTFMARCTQYDIML